MATTQHGVFTDDIPNRSPALIIISIVFLIVTTAFFAFRQGWRWAHRQRGLDDVMAACAYAVLLIQTIFGGIAAHHGFGKHRSDILATFPLAMKYFYLYQICYKLIGGFTKLTFCFLYRRIFSNQKRFQIFNLAVMAIVATGSFAFAIGTVFQCTPVHRAWDRRVPGHCISNVRFWYSHAAFNTFFDIVVYTMPIPLIRTLRMRRGQRKGLISIFAFGAFVIAASIVRMVMLRHSARTNDPTWGSMIALIWTEIEANTSVIVCCLPALRVPLVNLWHAIRGEQQSTTTTVDGPTGDSARTGNRHGRPEMLQDAPTSKSDHRSGGVRTNLIASHGKGSHSQSIGSRSHGGETWYEQVLASLNDREGEDIARIGSTDPLSQTEATAAPQNLEPNAIYKSTDMHVSTSDVRRMSKSDSQGEVSFAEMMRDGRLS